jgi:hypothetical protein
VVTSIWEEVVGFASFREALFLLGSDMAEKRGEGCEKCSHWREVKQRMRIANILAATVQSFEEKLKKGDFKPSVAEYLKLVQVEQEYEKECEGPKEITVTWVEPEQRSENSK